MSIKGRDIIDFISRHNLYDKEVNVIINVGDIYKVSHLQPTSDVTGKANGFEETSSETAITVSLEKGIKDIRNRPI